jgi:hypothetical protein
LYCSSCLLYCLFCFLLCFSRLPGNSRPKDSETYSPNGKSAAAGQHQETWNGTTTHSSMFDDLRYTLAATVQQDATIKCTALMV